MDIEFWWPYDEKNEEKWKENRKVGRFRKCKVVLAKVVPEKIASASNSNPSNNDIKRLLIEELGVSSKFFDSENWEQHLQSCIDILNNEEEEDPEEKELQVGCFSETYAPYVFVKY